MLVTQLQKITDRKYRVFLEDGMFFPLYAGEVRKYHICAGEELQEEVLREITDEVLTRRAKLRCLNLLKNMDRTEGQLRERLRRDGYPEEIADRAVAYSASFRYIDDSRYVRNYIRQMSGRKSRLQIGAELRQKGIDPEEIRRAFAEWQQEEGSDRSGEDPDVTAIRALARKRGFDPGKADREACDKFVRYLLRKGFQYSSITQALGRLPFGKQSEEP